MSNNRRYVKVSAVQCGPGSREKESNVLNVEGLLDKAALDSPDFVLFSELATTPYFASTHDNAFFNWAEPIPGETTERIGKRAAQHGIHVILPLFEKGDDGNFYNSAAVIGPDGKLVKGILPNGEEINCYRKTHIPASFDEITKKLRSDEKHYFKPGGGFPVFKTEKAIIGILICWDKRFFEGWRSLALSGAEIIFNPLATWGKWRQETYPIELRVMALYNQVFVVGCGKAGREELHGEIRDFGAGSFVVDPQGFILKQWPIEEGHVLSAVVDLAEVERTRSATPVYRDRRPEIYSMLTKKL